jgi:hypothetical protein
VNPWLEVVGVDVKRQARERNTKVAKQLGWGDCTFVEGTIADARLRWSGANESGAGSTESRSGSESGSTPDVDIVLALHACDTATDEAGPSEECSPRVQPQFTPLLLLLFLLLHPHFLSQTPSNDMASIHLPGPASAHRSSHHPQQCKPSCIESDGVA